MLAGTRRKIEVMEEFIRRIYRLRDVGTSLETPDNLALDLDDAIIDFECELKKIGFYSPKGKV